MAKIEGYDKLAKQLAALGKAGGGAALRASANAAMLPALQAARAAIPVADPPYHVGAGVRRNADGTTTYRTGAVRTIDPFPMKTNRGRLVTPGFAKRSLRRKTVLSADKTKATAMVGVLSEAFYVMFIEFGTRFIPKRPWLEPSFRGAVPAVDAALQANLRAKLDAAASSGNAPTTGETPEDTEQ